MAVSRRVAKGGVEFAVASGERADHDVFWDQYGTPAWEPETVAVLEAFARPGVRIVDVGGWIGPTVLLAASLGASVLAIEPDPVAAAALRRNVALNPELADRVTVLEAALAACDGHAVLVSPSPDGGDSLSHLAAVRDDDAWSCEVRTLSVATLLESPEAREAEFFKLDAEAAEYTIVPALREHIAAARPSLYIATHPNLLYDRRSARRRIESGVRALAANRRLLGAVATYRHHYAWRDDRLTDVRGENIRRLRAPLPARSSLLIGGWLFTDRTLSASAKGS
jgi:FkbM family methyltransferase